MKGTTMRILLILALLAASVAAETVTLDSATILDTRMNTDGATNNYGISITVAAELTSLSQRPGYIMQFDLSAITGTVDVSSVVCSLRTFSSSSDTNDAYIMVISTPWTEGVKDGAAVSSGNSGATWEYATDFYSGEGTDVAWESGASFGYADYDTIPVDTILNVPMGWQWLVFDGAGLNQVVEDAINGTSEVASFAVGILGSAERYIRTSEHTTATDQPKVVITYTAGAPAATGNIIRKGTIRKGTIR